MTDENLIPFHSSRDINTSGEEISVGLLEKIRVNYLSTSD